MRKNGDDEIISYIVFLSCAPPPMTPNLFESAVVMAWLLRESKHRLKAAAQADVPIMYSSIIFQPMKNAINSPTVT